MIFATYWFVAFSLIFFLFYWSIASTRFRFALLIGASALFHAHFAGGAGVAPILVLGVIVYFLGLLKDNLAHKIGIIICVLFLFTYKYTGFFIDSIIGLALKNQTNYGHDIANNFLPGAAPLAVSFFTFEFIHYLVDRHKGNIAIRKPADFAIFSIFFPTLVAGPIKRYEQFLPSIGQAIVNVNSRDVMSGLIQVAFGYSKKLVADNITLWIEHEQQNFSSLTIGVRWMLFAALGIRILFDFSGYSDIAIGLARMMGISLPANFNWPYLSTNIRDFWHRWHISLSTWIRDYVYIPLGGSRHGSLRRLFNGIAAFALCGLWHGPQWNFVAWGLYHGVGLSVSNAYKEIPWGIGRGLEWTFLRVPVLGWCLTLLFVCFGWLLFFYPVATAWEMTKLLFQV